MDFSQPVRLGQTELIAGRLGISSSFGAPCPAYEEAFEKGCNYFTWGTFIKGRSSQMRNAIKNIISKGERDNLILSIFSYSHMYFLMEHFLTNGLKDLGTDYADELILGYHQKPPSKCLLDKALQLKEKGLLRYLGLTSHKRKLFLELNQDRIIDIFHLRYNAAHRGAETDVFPYIESDNKPGIVSYTATRWGQLINPKKMPEDEQAPSAVDCYRFVLTNPAVDICMMGAKTNDQMRENLKALEMGPLNEAEMARMKKIGDFLYKK
jgi:predicted aldo/keto reductase-like oxidoreductase